MNSSQINSIDKSADEYLVYLLGGIYYNNRYIRDVTLRKLTTKDILHISQSSQEKKILTLLQTCITKIGNIDDVSQNLLGNLLLADRDFLLMSILKNTFGNTIIASTHCQNTKCNEPLDIDFTLDDIPKKHQLLENDLFTITAEHKGIKQHIEFRPVVWSDLQYLMAHHSDFSFDTLLYRLIQKINGKKCDKKLFDTILPETKTDIEKFLHDTLPYIKLDTDITCSECGTVFNFSFHPLQLLLNELNNEMENLFFDIHKIAFYYHWSENEILSMSLERKKTYLKFIEREIATQGGFIA